MGNPVKRGPRGEMIGVDGLERGRNLPPQFRIEAALRSGTLEERVEKLIRFAAKKVYPSSLTAEAHLAEAIEIDVASRSAPEEGESG